MVMGTTVIGYNREYIYNKHKRLSMYRLVLWSVDDGLWSVGCFSHNSGVSTTSSAGVASVILMNSSRISDECLCLTSAFLTEPSSVCC